MIQFQRELAANEQADLLKARKIMFNAYYRALRVITGRLPDDLNETHIQHHDAIDTIVNSMKVDQIASGLTKAGTEGARAVGDELEQQGDKT